MNSKTPRTDAYIGRDNEDYMTEGEVAICDFSRGLEIELNEASEEIAELKAKAERLTEAIRAATVLIAARGRHHTTIAYHGLKSLL